MISSSRLTYLLLIIWCACYLSFTSNLRLALKANEKRFCTTAFAAKEALPVLPVEEIAGRYKVVKFGQGPSSYNGLQVADRIYATKVVGIEMSRVGGLGLDLLEFPSEEDKGDMGLVLIGDVIPGSNG